MKTFIITIIFTFCQANAQDIPHVGLKVGLKEVESKFIYGKDQMDPFMEMGGIAIGKLVDDGKFIIQYSIDGFCETGDELHKYYSVSMDDKRPYARGWFNVKNGKLYVLFSDVMKYEGVIVNPRLK